MVGEKYNLERYKQNSNVKFMQPVLQPVVRKRHSPNLLSLIF